MSLAAAIRREAVYLSHILRTLVLLARIKPYVQAWYGTWHQGMVDQPFYPVNGRV